MLTPGSPIHFKPYPLATDSSKQKKASRTISIPEFVDETLRAGITFQHLQGGKQLTALNETLAPGACAFDYDNDGWTDLFLVNGSGQTRYFGSRYWWHKPKGNALYKNLGNNRFRDVTKQAGLSIQNWGMGCVSGDLDNDGDADLLITNIGSNYIYKNNGNGTFTNITPSSGISGDRWSTSATLADYDGDGLLDIYIANYVRFKKGAHTYEPDSQFAQDSLATFNAALYDSQENRLYRNLGNLKFKDMTQEAGVGNPDGRSLGAHWFYANDDDRLDLLVVNDKGSGSNTLFLNQDNGRFKKAGSEFRLSTALGATGISSGDIDNDGDQDIVIGSDGKHPPLTLINGKSPFPLHKNDAVQSRQFTDLTRPLGIGHESAINFANWSPGLYDFNNDGWLDLFMTNGLITPDPDTHKIPQGQSKQIWFNQGHDGFVNASDKAGVALMDRQSSRGAVFADFDNDGDIDIYVTNNNDLGQLLINNSTQGNWFGVHLEGKSKNRDAIGARVSLLTKSGIQHRVVGNSNGFMSSSDRRLHFGLYKDTKIHELKIRWPDSSITSIEDISANQYIKIKQGKHGFSPIGINSSRNKQDGVPSLKLGNKLANNRIQYLDWLISDIGIEQALPALEDALLDKDEHMRAGVIKLIKKHKHTASLTILIDALKDSSTSNRVSAINVIRDYEDELTVRWLLRSFNDSAPEVQSAVADTFAFFFREEEAVIHRKYLAVPYLIRQLDHSDTRVRLSAARALGDAERYRGVEPLIRSLSDDNIDVRVEIIRSLGLIRERKAIPALLKIAADTSQPPAVHAHALIALDRLDKKQSEKRLTQLWQGKKKTPPGRSKIRHVLDIYREIFKLQKDSVVISHNSLFQAMKNWLTQYGYKVTQRSDKKSIELTLQIIQTVTDSNLRQGVAVLKKHLSSKNSQTRAAAYQGLFLIDTDSRYQYATKALKDSSPAVQIAALNFLKISKIKVNKKLVLKGLTKKQTKLAAIPVMANYNDIRTAKHLLSIANNDNEKAVTRIAAINTLTSMKGLKLTIPNRLLIHPKPQIRQAALILWESKLARFITSANLLPSFQSALADADLNIRKTAVDLLLNRKETWARTALSKILFNHKANKDIRLSILNGLAQSHHPDTLKILRRLAQLRHDPFSRITLEKLAAQGNPANDNYMWRFLKNPNLDGELRFMAAKSLWSRNKKPVMALLQSGQ